MPFRRVRAVVVTALLVILTAVPRPAHARPASAPARPALRIATSGFVDSFNPFTSIYLLPTSTFRYMYENLVAYDQTDGSPTTGLADRWTTAEDGRTWTFRLQDGLTWSDGKPITAEDVVWTYTQMMTNTQMGQANGSLVANFSKVTAPDEHTVIIILKKPQAPNPGVEIPVVPKHVWSKIKEPWKYPNSSNAVGSGHTSSTATGPISGSPSEPTRTIGEEHRKSPDCNTSITPTPMLRFRPSSLVTSISSRAYQHPSLTPCQGSKG